MTVSTGYGTVVHGRLLEQLNRQMLLLAEDKHCREWIHLRSLPDMTKLPKSSRVDVPPHSNSFPFTRNQKLNLRLLANEQVECNAYELQAGKTVPGLA